MSSFFRKFNLKKFFFVFVVFFLFFREKRLHRSEIQIELKNIQIKTNAVENELEKISRAHGNARAPLNTHLHSLAQLGSAEKQQHLNLSSFTVYGTRRFISRHTSQLVLVSIYFFTVVLYANCFFTAGTTPNMQIASKLLRHGNGSTVRRRVSKLLKNIQSTETIMFNARFQTVKQAQN